MTKAKAAIFFPQTHQTVIWWRQLATGKTPLFFPQCATPVNTYVAFRTRPSCGKAQKPHSQCVIR